MTWSMGIAFALLGAILCTPLVYWRQLQRRGPPRDEVALTIDDGPHPDSTLRLLDALRAHQVTVTMFCPAARAAEHDVLMKRIRSAGHEVANHSLRHAASMALWPRWLSLEDLSEAEKILGGTRWFRPVAGVFSPPLRYAAAKLGLHAVGWTARALDGPPLRPSVDAVVRRLTRGLVPGGILVAHDVPTSPFIEALPALVAEAKRRGLRFVRLSEWLEPR